MKYLSFFSGALGLDIGLEQVGFKPALYCENDKDCIATIKANRPDIPLIDDIMNVTADKIKEKSGGDIDLIVGGPPCQSFSTAGKRKGFTDIRGSSFLKFIEICCDIKPRYVVIENVRGLLSASYNDIKGGAIDYVKGILESHGYTVSYNLYNTANYGVAQVRERIVILCVLNDKKKLPYLNPTHSHDGAFGLPKWRVLGDVIYDLTDDDNKEFKKIPSKRMKFYSLLKNGENWRNLPEKMQKEALGKAYNLGGGKTGFYRRLNINKPSPTLVTSPLMPATSLVHPTANRSLSVAEYKRIQGFPDDWILCGNTTSKFRQIGNAVPPLLGRVIAQTILNREGGVDVRAPDGFKFSRYRKTSDETK